MANVISESATSEAGLCNFRDDQNFSLILGLLRCAIIKPLRSGTIRMSPLTDFKIAHSHVPKMPGVMSSSNTSSEHLISQKSYIGPTTRSARRKALSQDKENFETIIDTRSRRSRSRSKTPAIITEKPHAKPSTFYEDENETTDKSTGLNLPSCLAQSDPHLDAVDQNPSPLIQIPIHRRWRVFIYQYEVPRKVLHVSIGVLSIYFYVSGVQTTKITPWLMGALIPIAATDYLRFNYEPLNRIYVQILGVLMRDSEYMSYNGVIWYLIGAWLVLTAFPKDIGLMGILLLSWCDTAASTIGRSLGRYTPSIRKGKSLAGSLAAFVVGAATAATFWGWLVPRTGPFTGDENFPFMFTGIIHLPKVITNAFGLTEMQASARGGLALAIMSLWTGLLASASEAINFFGLDDNLTIPTISGIGMWGFLKVFG